jgi:hypothetical protein
MHGLLSDINIQGQVAILRLILEGAEWGGIWAELALTILTFADVGLVPQTPDVLIWRLCQERGLILLTGNRNDDGPDSLESTIRNENRPDSLPVFTLADVEAVRHSRAYAERVVEKLIDYLVNIDNYRGTGRLYLP